MATKKTNFKKDNPALSFITPLEEEAKVQEETKATPIKKNAIPEGYKANPEYIETKSKRVQLLLQPSTVGSIKKLATKKGISMNEAINEAIQEYLSKEEGK
jgi:hypothetical protein